MEMYGQNLNKMKLATILISFLWINFVSAQNVAPDFEGKDLNGQHIKLSEISNRLIWLDFWASWCKPCKESFPFMIEMQSKYSEAGLKIIAINVDSDEKKMKSFLDELKEEVNFTILFDEGNKIIKSYNAEALPTSFFIFDGKILSTHQGFKKSDTKKIESEIIKLLENISD